MSRHLNLSKLGTRNYVDMILDWKLKNGVFLKADPSMPLNENGQKRIQNLTKQFEDIENKVIFLW